MTPTSRRLSGFVKFADIGAFEYEPIKTGQPTMRFATAFLLLFGARRDCVKQLELRGAAQGTTYHIKFVAPE